MTEKQTPVSPPLRLTAARLARAGAECEQLDAFEKEWPKGAEVTIENVRRAQELKLDLVWGAFHLFSPEGCRVFEDAIDEAWLIFVKAETSAWGTWRKDTIGFRRIFKRIFKGDPRRAYEEALAAPRRAYEEAEGPAWVAGYQATMQHRSKKP